MNRTHRPGYLVLSLVLALTPTPARAQWPENGVPVTTATGSQRYPAMVEDGQGGVFIAWNDTNLPQRVFLQRVGPDGQPAAGWPVGGIALGGPCYDGPPRICSDDAGGVYVGLRSSGPPSGFYLLRVTGSGAVAAGWPTGGQYLSFVNTPSTAALLIDGAGGAFVHWIHSYETTDAHGVPRFRTDVRLHHVLPSGAVATGWPENGRVVAGTNGIIGFSIGPDGQDGLSLAYSFYASAPGSTHAYGYFIHLDANGVATSVAGLQCTSGLETNGPLSLYPDPTGGAVVGFTERPYFTNTPTQRSLVKLDGSGQYVTGWAPRCQPFFGTAVALPSIVGDGASGVFLTWRDTRNSSEPDIYALRLDAGGLPAAGWSASGNAVSDAPGVQEQGPVIQDGFGGAFLAWVEAFDIYAQRIGPNGPGVAGWPASGLPVCTAYGAQQALQLVSDAVGGAFVCWEDYRNGSPDIYAYRLGPGGPVPVSLSVASTEVDADRVKIAWQLGEPLAGVVNVSKRTVEGDWTAERSVLPDGTGRIEYEDRAVRAGGRYGYRLEIVQSGETEYAGEVWVDIPSAAFGLGVLSPNPSASGWVVSLTLLDESGAALDLIDVQGRVVTTKQLGPLGAGPHQVAVGGSGSLPAGVYTLRLRHAGRTATARGAIVR